MVTATEKATEKTESSADAAHVSGDCAAEVRELETLVKNLRAELEKKKGALKKARALAKNRLEELNALKNDRAQCAPEQNEANGVRGKHGEQRGQGEHGSRTDTESVCAESDRLKQLLDIKETELGLLRASLEEAESRAALYLKSIDAIQKENARLAESYGKIDKERLRFSIEARRFKEDLDKLKKPPLLTGTVVKMLSDSEVVVRCSSGPELIVSASSAIDPADLKPDANVAMNQQTYGIVKIFPSFGEPDVAAMELVEESDVTYDQIGGLDAQIREIQEVVELPLTKPEMFEKVGIQPPGGALLYGPPGTGKTMIAKAVANRTNAVFFHAVGSELVQKYIGDGPKMVHELFDLAREKAPSIVFIDEIDAIASQRLDDSNGADREVHRTLIQLLAEMDGFTHLSNVQIIAATNRIDILDPAILRPGRFDRIIYVPLPDDEARLSILKIHTEKMNLSPDVDLKAVADMIDGANGAEIKAVTTESGIFAIRNDRTTVLQEDLTAAAEKVMDLKKKNALTPVPENMFL